MKKIVLGLVGVVVVLVAGVGVAAAMQPDEVYLERSVTVAATPQDVRPLLDNYRNFVKWSPWTDLDPEQAVEFSDGSGPGSWYSWNGNDEVGEGRMDLLEENDGEVIHKLTFLRPMEDDATTRMLYAAEGDGTKVTWTFEDTATFGFKVFSLFGDFEGMLGGDYESGLANLAELGEQVAGERMKAEEAAKADADAAAQEAEASEG